MSFKSILYCIPLLISNVLSLDLVPIHSLEDITGLHTASKRASNYTGDLDLQDVESFFWGAPSGDNLVYANMTVYFPDQYENIIAMERFAGKLKSVNCADNMILEFVDKAAFDYAQNVWNWVNQESNNTFIMVTNYEGCADDMERLPFEVSNIAYDNEANTAYLAAELKSWEDISHSYTLHIGHVPLTPVHRMMMERGLMARDTDFTLNLASSFNQNLFTNNLSGWVTSVDANLQTTGSLNVDFDLDVDWFKIKSAGMMVNPVGISASLELALSQTGTLLSPYTWQGTIVSVPIQGITIAHVVKLGAFLDIDVGFTMQEWTGAAHAGIGAMVSISDDAIVQVDLVQRQNNKFSGWTPQFSVIPPTLSARVHGSAQAYASPNVNIEASALGLGFNVGIGMKLPYIEAEFEAIYDSTGGVCASDNTFGVGFNSTIGVDISAQAAFGDEANPFWQQQILAHEWPLFDTCLAFGASGASQGEVAALNAEIAVAATQSQPFTAVGLEDELTVKNSTATVTLIGIDVKNTTSASSVLAVIAASLTQASTPTASAIIPGSSAQASAPTASAIYFAVPAQGSATPLSSSTPAVPTKTSTSLIQQPTSSTVSSAAVNAVAYDTQPSPAASTPSLATTTDAEPSSTAIESEATPCSTPTTQTPTSAPSSTASTPEAQPTPTVIASEATPCSTLITATSTPAPVATYPAQSY